MKIRVPEEAIPLLDSKLRDAVAKSRYDALLREMHPVERRLIHEMTVRYSGLCSLMLTQTSDYLRGLAK